jgi:predicted nuclease with TOPRIM domain
MNWELIVTIIGSGSGGAILIKAVEVFILPKKDEKEFDEKVRDELWDRVKNLEGRLDEQNKMILEVMKENAGLKIQLEAYKQENADLKGKLQKHIDKG